MINKIEGVIFDCSGVLIDDLEASYKANLEVLKHFHVCPLSMRDYRRYIVPYWRFYVRVGISERQARSEAPRLFKHYLALQSHQVKVFPEAAGTMSDLRENGLRLAVASQLDRASLRRFLRRFGLLKFMDAVVALEDCREVKPSPGPVLVAATRLRTRRFALVGDTLQDIEAGKAAGATTVALAHKGSYHTKSTLRAGKPDYLINSLRDLPALFADG